MVAARGPTIPKPYIASSVCDFTFLGIDHKASRSGTRSSGTSIAPLSMIWMITCVINSHGEAADYQPV